MKKFKTTILKTKKTSYFKYLVLFPVLIAISFQLFSTFYNNNFNNKLLATNNWINYAESFSGSGTSSSPYLIKKPEHLAYLAQQVNAGNAYANKYFKLENYIDLKKYEWTPIGIRYGIGFCGHFNGNGYAILNMHNSGNIENNGLFGYAWEATIKDVFLIGGKLETNSSTIGGLAGYAYSTNIEKVYSTVEIINNSNDSFTGGIIGNAVSIEMKKIINRGKVTGKNQVGGIAGRLTGNLLNSYNIGNVDGKNQVGGIAGRFGSVTSDDYKISESYNAGDIFGNNYVGGIAGEVNGSEISTSYNAGEIMGGNYTGGIAGIATNTTISNVYNHQESLLLGNFYVGGILGASYDGTAISDASNSGEIEAFASVGGIVGYAENSGIVRDCTNLGTIKAVTSNNGKAGGILGQLNFTSNSTYTIRFNSNQGFVNATNTSSTDSEVGGIVGYILNNSTKKPTLNIEYNFNIGDVEGIFMVGGIFGNMTSNAKSDMIANINFNSVLGKVIGSGFVGGIGGNLNEFDTSKYTRIDITFTKNFYGGKIQGYYNESSGTYLGSFLGKSTYSEDTSGDLWNNSSNNYVHFDFDYNFNPKQRDNHQLQVFPIGTNLDPAGLSISLKYYETSTKYYSTGIYIVRYDNMPNLTNTSYLGSNFQNVTNFGFIPNSARRAAVSNVLNTTVFENDSGGIGNYGHPFIKDFYWMGELEQIYTIFIETDGGSNIKDKTFESKTTSQTISLGSPTKTGYKFDKWVIVGSANGATISGNYLNLPANFSNNIYIKATWKAKLPNLTYLMNPGGFTIPKEGEVKTITATNGSGALSFSYEPNRISIIEQTNNSVRFEILPYKSGTLKHFYITLSRTGCEPITISFTQGDIGLEMQ